MIIACRLCSENGQRFLWLGDASQEEAPWESQVLLLKGIILYTWSLVHFVVEGAGGGARKFWFLQKELVCGQERKAYTLGYFILLGHIFTSNNFRERKKSNQFPSAHRVDCSGRRVASLDVDGVIKVWSFNPIMQTKASSISKSPLLSLEWATKRDRLVSSLPVEAWETCQMIWGCVAAH